jgi:hypothetical protein
MGKASELSAGGIFANSTEMKKYSLIFEEKFEKKRTLNFCVSTLGLILLLREIELLNRFINYHTS